MKVDTAVVLAGGPGTRLRPLTNGLPKGMIGIYGKPLLEWIIEWLRENGVKNIVLGVAYLKENIMDYFGDGRAFNVYISYSVHSVEGGTGEGFRLAINGFVNKEIFLAMNGDQITDLRLKDLVGFHTKHGSTATVAVVNPRCPYGHVKTEGNDITGFLEKPVCPYAFCNSGIYVFNREILRYLPERGDVENTTFPVLAKSRRLKAYPIHGFFITINTQKDLSEAEMELRRGYR